MHAEGFTLFPANSITADTNTREFDCANFKSFYLVVVVTILSGGQTITPRMEMRLPDGVTFRQLAAVTTPIAATGTFVYYIGEPVQSASGLGGGVTEALICALPRNCRLLLDLVNAVSTSLAVHVVPA